MYYSAALMVVKNFVMASYVAKAPIVSLDVVHLLVN